MTSRSLTFDAVSEDRPGPKWRARWDRSWPAYEAWFVARGGDAGPPRAECEAALAHYMPELVPVHRALVRTAGGGDRAARFLSTWCPPAYLGGCSLAARADGASVRLVRNYDLSPDLNEGLLLRSAWTGKPVMGMVEFLWGLSDGVNADGLAVALAFGGRCDVSLGFGVTTILRYVLETCATVDRALEVLARVPSHMAYNVTLADRHGATASVELAPGGGMRRMPSAIATNHQHGAERAERPGFTRTAERRAHLQRLFVAGTAPADLADAFLREPLFQTGYADGFGTLFTADYAPAEGALTLRWPGRSWHQHLDAFAEGRLEIDYGAAAGRVEPSPAEVHEVHEALAAVRPFLSGTGCARFDAWLGEARQGRTDWASLGAVFAA
ncbi:MAG TPA: C45 family peptidase [Thermohalobaculum sp.]|nr:C45 family peptidase [Thermohalobaculum sp.]